MTPTSVFLFLQLLVCTYLAEAAVPLPRPVTLPKPIPKPPVKKPSLGELLDSAEKGIEGLLSAGKHESDSFYPYRINVLSKKSIHPPPKPHLRPQRPRAPFASLPPGQAPLSPLLLWRPRVPVPKSTSTTAKTGTAMPGTPRQPPTVCARGNQSPTPTTWSTCPTYLMAIPPPARAVMVRMPSTTRLWLPRPKPATMRSWRARMRRSMQVQQMR